MRFNKKRNNYQIRKKCHKKNKKIFSKRKTTKPKSQNLNHLVKRSIINHNIDDITVPIDCRFNNILEILLKCIDESYGIVGCVAWLSHPSILHALQKKHFIGMVVQKEAFLKPQFKTSDRQRQSWSNNVRMDYKKLPNAPKYLYDTLGNSIDYHKDDEKKTSSSSSPPNIVYHGELSKTSKSKLHTSRMHHKFLIFFNSQHKPERVWTGSFNFTKNAEMSLENALIITHVDHICNSYLSEWSSIYKSSTWNTSQKW